MEGKWRMGFRWEGGVARSLAASMAVLTSPLATAVAMLDSTILDAPAGVPLEMLSTRWFLCLFIDVLPAQTLLRVWDVMLWEGPTVLLRAGAALLHCNREAVLAATDFHTISLLVPRLGHDFWHADGLLTIMYNKGRRVQQKLALRHAQRERRHLLEAEDAE